MLCSRWGHGDGYDGADENAAATDDDDDDDDAGGCP
jgi:hypothetical protein